MTAIDEPGAVADPSLDGPAVGVIVVAAGSGTRLGAGIPKAFVSLAGSTVLEHALAPVFRLRDAVQVVVVVPADRVGQAETIGRRAAGKAADHLRVVAGGDTRQSSVLAGLAALWPGVRTVLVHDAARALTPTGQFERVIEAAERTGWGIVPGLAVTDTIKRVDASDLVEQTVDRTALRAVQTPQAFPRDALVAAFRVAEDRLAAATDDAALYADAGHPVLTVGGSEAAFKITTPWDAQRAERLLADRERDREHEVGARTTTSIRTGIGIDVHAFADDGELSLAGLSWPGERPLAGHSDGDAVAHAIVDALLSAAGLGDIGSMFGTDDPRFAGASGEVFLRAAVERLHAAGFVVVNVAVQLVGNRPRFAPRRAEAEGVLSALVHGPVSVAATTTDALGFTGRGEGVTAIATALIERR
ncbi:2-C-methyl-D-erythritol 2,4-cyclodiphosphate synthase [Plantibacter sp. H53]|uniref:bifunctional 2-C-methyl-D-erythritol 4-phosphate cytidylyltransferase/2-C-methyl-D-erythritol 2,4-cyclodiphosphate synthase n=1 Tax=Plantibacter sp. H53 TaxID=1827323 RepID=UPI0007D9EA58|nr:bifunctional 2-C-methyl-D-erythritol 4-phosphate cytidylyltransferase/2-C-methyl-D-erythritol 2,4-cyclodiphosphate synthase [Plantibacter sp. H53]OAN28860.1 2-C-methyl-D-erythritol 2,4-cyclodiphosphate synthase [Plantibacter sp. H53]